MSFVFEFDGNCIQLEMDCYSACTGALIYWWNRHSATWNVKQRLIGVSLS